MSGIWADFDPLSKNRAKPAAPVTSMEQAEARPIKSPPLSKHSAPSSPTAPSEPPAQAQRTESEHAANASDKEKKEYGLGLQITPTPGAEAPDQPAPPPHEQDRATPPAKDEETNEELSPAADSDRTEARSEANAVADTDAAPISLPEEDAASRSDQPQGTETPRVATDERSAKDEVPQDWPGKLELPADEAEGSPHHGDLRKNSIAAMKELGSPNANDAASAAAAPAEDVPFDFQKFMSLLRSRSADPIARYIKSFLQEFSRGVWSPTQQEKIVADFQKFISVKMREFEPFASLSKRDRRNASEGVEKLIMNRLYPRTFPPKMAPILRTDGHNEDLLRDQVFEEKLRLWSWVEGRHLDINEGYLQSSFIQLAANELGKLHQFKSPRDKTICILNCSKVVWALIRQAKLEQNADSFLPLLIYVVIKAQPVHLVSSINYIQRFRSKEFLKGETAYYLSTLASAVAFVETLDKSSLTISNEEFDEKMDESIKAENRYKEELQREQLQPHPDQLGEDDGDLEAHEGESSAAVLAASAGMLVDRMRSFTTRFLEDISTPEDAATADQNGERPSPTSSTNHGQNTGTRQARNQFRAEEQAAREASREVYRTEQLQRQQFNETSETLQQMFPALDKDVVDDVLLQCGTNIGRAVDLCLTLVETS